MANIIELVTGGMEAVADAEPMGAWAPCCVSHDVVPNCLSRLAACVPVRPASAQQPTVEIKSTQLLFLAGVVMSETGTVVVVTVRGAIGDQRVIASRISPGSSQVDREIVLQTVRGSLATPNVAIARTGNNAFVVAGPECEG